MYANDTSLGYASNSIDDITKSMNIELKYLRKWLHGNKLTLNVTKTISMIIGTKRSCIKVTAGSLYRHISKYQEKQWSRKHL